MKKKEEIIIEMPPLPQDAVPAESPAPELPPELAQAQAIERGETQEETAPELMQEAEEQSYISALEKESVEEGPKKSWNDLRQQVARAAKERDEALARLRDYEKAQSEDHEDFSINLGESELAEGKHLSKLEKEIKRLRNQVKQSEQRASILATDALLKAQYPDLDKVVSSENMEMLRSGHPELYSSIAANPDLYSKAVAAYKLIKTFTGGSMTKNNTSYEAEKSRVTKNLAKPRALGTIAPQSADNPLSRVNAFSEGLTPDLQKQLLKEMAEARKGF